MKKQLFFVSQYTGDFKYYSKLIKYLENKYEVGFLFIPDIIPPTVRKGTLAEMTQYCERNNYSYYIIYKPISKYLKILPFFRPLKQSYEYRNEYRRFLNSHNNIEKLIGTADHDFFMGCLFDEANKKGIDTMVLQWAITNFGGIKRIDKLQEISQKPFLESKKELITLAIKRIYSFLLLKIQLMLGFYYVKSINLGGGPAKKMGVINQYSYDCFKKMGVAEKKMTVVGMIDFDETKNILNNLNNNPELKKEVAQKYNIDLNKKNIVIYSYPQYINELTILTPKQQVEHYYETIEIIREIFPKESVDILFKIHPVEPDVNLYSPLKKLGVKLYGKDTTNEELIYFADLYVGGCSTSNIVPIIMGKDAIFTNLTNLKSIEILNLNKTLSIKKFISDQDEFKKLLIDFKNGRLAKQYAKDNVIDDGKCIERIIKWIG